MVLFILAVDEDVINVDNDKLVKVGSEDILHKSLEGSWGIGETKRHDSELIMTIVGPEGSFLHIIWMNADLIISPMKINLREYLGMVESVQEVINQGNGELILDGDLVQCLIVNAYVQASILFLHEDDRGTKGGDTRFDGSILEESVKFFLEGIKFQRGHLVDGSPRGLTARF